MKIHILNHFVVYQKLTKYYKSSILQLKSREIILYLERGDIGESPIPMSDSDSIPKACHMEYGAYGSM